MPGFHDRTTEVVLGGGGSPVRLLLLLVAGVFLIGGVWLFINKHHQEEASVPTLTHQPGIGAPRPPVATAPLPTASGVGAPSAQKSLAAQPGPVGTAATPPIALADKSATATVKMEPVPAPAVSTDSKGVPATSRLVAATEAHANAGRPDPCSPVPGYPGFPRFNKVAPTEAGTVANIGKEDIPPPPPPSKEQFVPPPPPGAETAGSPAADVGLGLSDAELPAPPTKPSLANKMKLTAVVGDRAVLAFTDPLLRLEHKWPKTVTLGTGEQFESVSVVSVNGDSVTIDEDGDRSVKTIAPIK